MNTAIIGVLIGVGVTIIINIILFAYFTGRQTQATEHLRLEIAKLGKEVRENNKQLWDEVNNHSRDIVKNREIAKSAHNRLDDFEKRLINIKGA